MAEVEDHLVPTDGLTNSVIRYAGLGYPRDGGRVTHFFEMIDEKGERIGSFPIEIRASEGGSVDKQIALAHQRMPM